MHGAYVIHLDLESFIAQGDVTEALDEAIYIQDVVDEISLGAIVLGYKTFVVATYAEVGGTIHACRVPVERRVTEGDSLLKTRILAGEDAAVELHARQCRALLYEMRENLERAKSLLALVLPGDQLRTGILAVPGMLTDLRESKTQQHIWQWDSEHIATRRIVPMPGSAAS